MKLLFFTVEGFVITHPILFIIIIKKEKCSRNDCGGESVMKFFCVLCVKNVSSDR